MMRMQAMKKKRNKDKRKSVGVTMPPQLLRRIDLLATKVDRSRSNVICEALRGWLAQGEV
jgi:metal-responsive CopG/Arc/MetJ family transcriptional regulator